MASEASITEAATYPRGFSRDTDWQWPMVPARKLVTLNYGRALKADTRSPGKVPVYGTNGQCGWHNKSLAKAPGLILGRKGQGPLGVEWCEKDFWVIDTAYYASTLTPDIDLKYLYHVVKYIGLNHLKDGTSNPTLSRDTFGAQLFPLPPLAEQKRIAHILGTLDDKIELNRRMNATLEAMARALFQSWFVDFDPVRRNAEGGDSRPEDVLFPDSFEKSALGEIPKGWKSAKVSEICKNIFSGGTPKTSEASYWDGAFPWLSSGETHNSFIIETEKTITQLGIDKSSTRLARKGCVVIASAGQGHTRGQTSLLAFDSYINQSVVALAADSDVASDLFFYFDLSRRYDEFRQLSDSHSSRGSLTTKLLGGVQLVLPAKHAIQKFDSIVSPMIERIVANLRQSRALASIRDTLLPKLLSGDLAVHKLRSLKEKALA
jgi:type I restriction enzyme, S subunit